MPGRKGSSRQAGADVTCLTPADGASPGPARLECRDLPADLGGAEALTATQMALVGMATRTCLYVDHLRLRACKTIQYYFRFERLRHEGRRTQPEREAS